MNTNLQQAVNSLRQLAGQVASDAPELTNEYNHLLQVGSSLAAGNPSVQQISQYGQAVQNFTTVLNASDDTLKLEIIGIAENIITLANDLNPLSVIPPNNPNSPLYNPCTQSSGIYWTGILILAGCVGGALVLRKVRG